MSLKKTLFCILSSIPFSGFLLLFVFFCRLVGGAEVLCGVDRLFDSEYRSLVEGKRVGLLTNHTGINREGVSTIDVVKQHHHVCTLMALFAPEHGIDGSSLAGELVGHAKDSDGLPIYSLHGVDRRPNDTMMKEIDCFVVDLQDVGLRCYTYSSTVFYVMEEAARWGKKVIVLDRPNPINGVVVDGPMLEMHWRSFIGYIDVPLCHGMTIGELARYFNEEHEVKCDLEVVPMKGWERTMSFGDTDLVWLPPSPQIPEADTCLVYPCTNVVGEILSGLSVGVGYTRPFKVVGAPWIDGKHLAKALNRQNFPGVRFDAAHFRPFFGTYKEEACHGLQLTVVNPIEYQPVATQYLILGALKNLYPKEFAQGLKRAELKRDYVSKALGTDRIYPVIKNKRYIVWELIEIDQKKRKDFLEKRKAYLLY